MDRLAESHGECYAAAVAAEQQRWASRVRAEARALGFDAAGFAAADALPAEHYERFCSFVARGLHGDMGYLARHAAARAQVNGPAILAGARSVISVALSYAPSAAALAAAPPVARLIAYHARGRDYHQVMKERLQALVAVVRGLAPGVRARALCDTAPVLERAWAARAGLGYVGKNGMLIVPGLGSYVVLGEVVTTLALPPSEPRASTACEGCDACLRRCPTGALVAPYQLDPRRCISYGTIEARRRPPPSMASAVSDQLFGCDLCQRACPANDVSPPDRGSEDPFAPLRRWADIALADFVSLSPARWRELAAGTTLCRLSAERLAQNAVLVAAARVRRGDTAARAILERAERHPDAVVRAVAAEQLGGLPASRRRGEAPGNAPGA